MNLAALAVALAWSYPLVAQQTYTWSNGAGTNLWGTGSNWVGSPTPTFNNQTDLIFNSADVLVANRSNAISIGAGAKTIRSLTINADYATSSNATFDIRTNDTFSATSTARNLTFAANTGNASITVGESTAGTVQVRVGSNGFGNIVLSSNLDIAQNNTFFGPTAFQLDSSITGSGTITKTGAGVVGVIRNNSWSGGLNINEGSVQIFSSGSAMGTGAWTLGGAANSTTLRAGSTVSFINSGGLTVAAGSGARTIANMSTGVAAGVGNPTLAGAITLNKDAIFDITQYAAGTHDRLTVTGTVTGTGGIIKANSGILILSASNSYVGTTVIQGGKLYLSGAGRLGSGAVTIASGANLDFGTGTGQINVVANDISGDGQIIQSTAGTDTRLTGNVTSTGGLGVQNGTVRIGNNTATGSYSGDVTVSAGASLAFARSNAYTHDGTISGAGAISKVNAGTVTLTGSNSYSGLSQIFDGTIVADNVDALGTGDIRFNALGGGAPILQYTANSASTDWASRFDGSDAPIRLDTAGNNGTLAGVIDSTNTGGLIKRGAGVLTLGGVNTYTGVTNAIAGGLIINGSQASAGLATVSSGAWIGGTGSLAGDLSILSGGLFAFNPLDPTLDVAGAVSLDNTFGVASLVNPDGSAIDWGSVADGSYTLIGATASSFANIQNFGVNAAASIGTGRTAYFTEGSLQLVVVPEPGAFALAGLGIAAAAWARRRR